MTGPESASAGAASWAKAGDARALNRANKNRMLRRPRNLEAFDFAGVSVLGVYPTPVLAKSA